MILEPKIIEKISIVFSFHFSHNLGLFVSEYIVIVNRRFKIFFSKTKSSIQTCSKLESDQSHPLFKNEHLFCFNPKHDNITSQGIPPLITKQICRNNTNNIVWICFAGRQREGACIYNNNINRKVNKVWSTTSVNQTESRSSSYSTKSFSGTFPSITTITSFQLEQIAMWQTGP